MATEVWSVGDRVECPFHHGIPATITRLLDDQGTRGGFAYVLDRPHDLGPRHGEITGGEAFDTSDWRHVRSEGTFDDGVQALADHLRMRAANNWHGRPAADAICKQENALIEEWLRDALAEIEEERAEPRL